MPEEAFRKIPFFGRQIDCPKTKCDQHSDKKHASKNETWSSEYVPNYVECLECPVASISNIKSVTFDSKILQTKSLHKKKFWSSTYIVCIVGIFMMIIDHCHYFFLLPYLLSNSERKIDTKQKFQQIIILRSYYIISILLS